MSVRSGQSARRRREPTTGTSVGVTRSVASEHHRLAPLLETTWPQVFELDPARRGRPQVEDLDLSSRWLGADHELDVRPVQGHPEPAVRGLVASVECVGDTAERRPINIEARPPRRAIAVSRRATARAGPAAPGSRCSPR